MSSEVKGHDVNFVYRGKSFHLNPENLNEEDIQREISEITSAICDGKSSYTLKYNVEVDTKNIDVVMKKTLENDKHIKFPKILIGVLTLIAVIIVFYFGGSIIETFYNIGRTLENAIGDLFWK